MKIAIIGFYGVNNAGDERIQKCICKMFPSEELLFLGHNDVPDPKYLKNFDRIIIGGGGLVQTRIGIWKDMKKWIKSAGVKIGVLGLGVNYLAKGMKEELLHLLDEADFFYVRDQESKHLIGDDPRIKVYPDVTWCYPVRPAAKDVLPGRIAVNLCQIPWKPGYQSNKWVKELLHFDVAPFPLYFKETTDLGVLRKIAKNVMPEEFCLDILREAELLIAARYHAIIFAMQLGKPVIAVNYDDKVKRIMCAADMSELCLEVDQHRQVANKIKYVRKNKKSILEKMEKFASRQEAEAGTLLRDVRQKVLAC